MTRASAREIAVIALYSQSLNHYSPEELLDSWLDVSYYDLLSREDPLFETPPGDDAAAFIRRLVSGVAESLPELDSRIESLSVGWELNRMPRTALAVLRAAFYEILHMPDVPPAAAINSHLNILKRYDTPEVVAFVNGILGSLMRADQE